MTTISNPTAGMADPFWYEWLVGLFYALDMLNPDNDIESVTFQASKLQGLDDVVINYNNGLTECIQVKHTREDDSLTFSDLIRNDNGKNNSYIYKFSSDWLNALKIYGMSKAVLFTNRLIGKKKYNVKQVDEEGYERPPLDIFWAYIKIEAEKASILDDINIKEGWKEAWDEFLNETKLLDDSQKLLFIKNFEIKADQADLDEIIEAVENKISDYFKTEEQKTTQLFKLLSSALIKWTTTLRKNEKIHIEDLLEAISLSSDDLKGIHYIPTNEPFFNSRVEFANQLEGKLRNREYPLVFLYGYPGTGKTNIVSHLTNRVNSAVTLRFYAFKPLTSDDPYLSADKGVSDPRALWGDLLIQLRKLLKGKLAKHRVPVSNELLGTIDELRNEVIRLSVALSTETGRTTVIAIDGIDHAARSGEANTFLTTLLSPKNIPKEICFLIAGQPIYEHDSYPIWLTDDEVLSIEVPQLQEDDILGLFNQSKSKISSNNLEVAVKIINKHVQGNTLSAIFAVKEAEYCENLDQLEERLEEVGLSGGISSYYEYIWKSALNNIPDKFFYVDKLLAGVLTLLTKRITPKMINDIYKEESIGINLWKRIMQKMYPIIIEEKEGYRVFHNDVRIFLEKYLRRDVSSFKEISSKLADYYMSNSDDSESKHELIFTLLDNSNRRSDYINVFNTEYVMEAFAAERPIQEIMEQLDLTIKSLLEMDDIKKIRRLIYPVATMYQFFYSWQWADRQYNPIIPVQKLLGSEKRVVLKSSLSIYAITGMLMDINLLIEHNEMERARNILVNCIGEMTLEDILDTLVKNDNLDKGELETELGSELEWIFKTVGEVYQIIGDSKEQLFHAKDLSERYKIARAYFTKGWLDKGRLYLDEDSISRTINKISWFYAADLQSYIMTLMDYNVVDKVVELTKKYKNSIHSKDFKLRLATWSIINGQDESCKDIIDDIINYGFDYVDNKYDSKVFNLLVLIAFILAYNGSNNDDIIKLFFKRYRDGKTKESDRDYYAAYSLITVSTYLGFMYRCLIQGNNDAYFKIQDFEWNLRILLSDEDNFGRFEISSLECEKYLLGQYIEIANKMGNNYQYTIHEIIKNKAIVYKNTRYLDLYWEFLKGKKEIQILENLYDYWMSDEGQVWNLEIADLLDLSDNFINKAYEMDWVEKAEKAKVMQKQKIIGYTGHKEYSLHTPLKWYKRLDIKANNLWKDIGIKFLNISKNVSNLGDNRASVQIKSAISESAGTEGFKDLWYFSNLTNDWDDGWIRIFYDGIIKSLHIHSLSEQELLKLWKLSTKIFYVSDTADSYDINQNLRKIYISDIKEAILLAADRLEYTEIQDKMKSIDEYAYSINRLSRNEHSYIISKRWYEDNIDTNKFASEFRGVISQLTIEEAYKYLLEKFNNRNDSYRWDFIVEFISKIKKEKASEINTYSSSLLAMLLMREESYRWEFDGINRAYEVLIPYLEVDELKEIFFDIVKRYFSYDISKYNDRIDLLNHDLENFIYYYFKVLPYSDNKEVMESILDMHKTWMTGNGTLEIKTYYEINETLGVPTSWMDFLNSLESKLFYTYI